MKADNEANKQIKQKEQSNLHKFLQAIYFILCGNDDLDRSINRSIISNTYQQIAEVIHCIILYTWLQKTLNSTFNIIQVIISAVIILICLIPRLITKYYGFLITMLTFITMSIASAAINSILIINYQTFSNYCSILGQYSQRNTTFEYEASSMCHQITNLYHLKLGFQAFMLFFRSIYIILIIKAYRISKKIFDEEQKKRRRQQKYDQNIRNKNIFNPNRKI